MTSVRLLPIVIAAGAALLLLKSVGLVTDGGYVLSGPAAVLAADGHDSGSGAAATGAATAVEPVMADGSPTMQDGAPTLPLGAGSGPGAGHLVAEVEAGADDSGQGGAEAATVGAGADTVAEGEAAPMIRDGAGEAVPLSGDEVDSEEALLQRLGDRRGDLDAREAELDMRLALIEAAEQRIEQRTAALEALEARIAAMVEEKKALEEEQFVAIIAMYESMKARDAAPIFDQLEMPVLLRVARAMSPRKMAPILAEMDPLKARDLTANMAIDRVEPTIDMPPADFADLPQIVGQ